MPLGLYPREVASGVCVEGGEEGVGQGVRAPGAGEGGGGVF